ncbi:CehA/McbA family metallohydrolase [Clostridium ganghwense]|uniref:CehA/McbA family metallohydrolase n=1 Tax=Clostridium ganghwense TaxID=312089 RepID=A0ABT4CPW3_9CLOT|nr:CehA/McbA family metallohydrolase [Clostridium ganghwense]
MIKWIPYELHNHTNHSDGKHTFEELLKSAREIGLKGIAITDHNTISTFDKIESLSKEYGINIIKGLEWTTFWGHILLVGINEYVDWREVTLENFNGKLREAKNKSKLIGVAHPYRLGGPIGTGCFFEYNIEEWKDIDYIEVWSGMLPSEKQMNKRAYELWTKLLNSGLEISAVSGRDWHKSKPDDKYISCTYVGLDDHKRHNSENVIEAIKYGRCVVGFGYKVTFQIKEKDKVFNIGDRISTKNITDSLKLEIKVVKGDTDSKSEIDEKNLVVKVKSNRGEVFDLQVNNRENMTLSLSYNDEINWMIAELYEIVGDKERMIAFTNPIYFHQN